MMLGMGVEWSSWSIIYGALLLSLSLPLSFAHTPTRHMDTEEARSCRSSFSQPRGMPSRRMGWEECYTHHTAQQQHIRFSIIISVCGFAVPRDHSPVARPRGEPWSSLA
uniref:Putative secreted protein n=1 Tax=Anopheles darlingi TaxID=43151 RepID=A0A2M4DEI5_ANODA